MLSRGQKQRLGLARALVHDPHVLLLDEPASGLDPQARIDLRVLLRRFAAEGRTVLVSSHVLSELEEVIDDAVFLVAGETVDAGRVAAAAQQRSLVAHPHRRCAARRCCGIRRSRRSRATPATSLIDRQDVLVAFATEGEAVAALRRLRALVAVLEIGGRGVRLPRPGKPRRRRSSTSADAGRRLA